MGKRVEWRKVTEEKNTKESKRGNSGWNMKNRKESKKTKNKMCWILIYGFSQQKKREKKKTAGERQTQVEKI